MSEEKENGNEVIANVMGNMDGAGQKPTDKTPEKGARKKNAAESGQKTVNGFNIEKILSRIYETTGEVSSEALLKVISALSKEQVEMSKREEEEKRLKALREKEEKERKAKEKKEAHIREVTCMDLPLDFENSYAGDARAEGVYVERIPDALVLCLTTLGCVDIEYIAAVTGETYKAVIQALKGSIYQNPETWGECFYKGWETADEYLTGNLVRKWNAAFEANRKYNGFFNENTRAIAKLLPPQVASQDIYVTLGSPWIPAKYIDDFIIHLFSVKKQGYETKYGKVLHDELTGTWDIPDTGRFWYSPISYSTYGTQRMGALTIMEKTLNMKTISVFDEVTVSGRKSKRRVLNKNETLLAIEKQKALLAEFRKWIWQDEKRKEELLTIYEEKFSSVRTRTFDGSFLDFPTMSPAVSLYGYQKNAVARILFSPNTLLAHDVGAGKTYVMIAAGMELRRMGISKKHLYVVPNNLVGQWEKIFLTMYPTARVLCVDAKNFSPAKRNETLEMIRDNDYDGIIMAYSSFDMIPLSKECYVETLKAEKAAVEALAEENGKNTSALKRESARLEKALTDLVLSEADKRFSVFFDELGIERMFVDEAHNYKNVLVDTKVDFVHGISKTGSEKCNLMMDKVHFIQKQNGGKGIVFATGTPITNSITDIFVMQKYLQSGELALLDLQSFDSWIGMFAEKQTEFEIDVDTSNYRLVTRFSKFHNIPELTSLLASIADFHGVEAGGDLPTCRGYQDVLITRTGEFAEYLKKISKRADAVRSGYMRRDEDNMLKITTDGRKAALDMRLVDTAAPFSWQSKVAHCAENVYDIYFKTMGKRSTQLVFCDTSTPKNGFNVYDELKRLLVFLGISPDKVAYVHDADSETKRNKLFAEMRSGQIRVLIGSTFKLGLGVNVQDKLIAVHHLDVPWRPADMVQREGRILRQGNENKEVFIYRYITEGSFDAYSWQLLETKQRFIQAILSGSIGERSGSDVDDTVLNYAEVKALAIGNPLIKTRVETANELVRYTALQKKYVETQQNLERRLLEIPSEIKHQKQVLANVKDDRDFYAENKQEYDMDARREIRQLVFDAVQKNQLQPQERELLTYQGFKVVLPMNMIPEKPYLWLKRAGKYCVELGEADRGALIRIDHTLDTLGELYRKHYANYREMQLTEKKLKDAIDKNESYADKIEDCRKRLEKIDEKLGVNKNE